MNPEIAQRCDLFYGALSDFLDGTLEAVDMAYVEEHLKLCPPCETYLDQFRAVSQANEQLHASEASAEVKQVLADVLKRWKETSDGSA